MFYSIFLSLNTSYILVRGSEFIVNCQVSYAAVLVQYVICIGLIFILMLMVLHCVSKKNGPLLPFTITPTVLVQ